MTTQLTRDDLAGMTPEAINTARTEGRLDALLTGNTATADARHKLATTDEQLTRDDVAALHAAGREHDINQARAAGRLADLLTGDN